MDSAQQEREMAAVAAHVRRVMSMAPGPGSAPPSQLKLPVESDDFFVVTTAKAGTTWMQQICHQLRSGTGDMDFEEISDLIPFVEMTPFTGINLEAEQRFKPRVFKTHLWEPLTPKGGRYIIVVRHPYDVAVSVFKFLEGWMFEEGDISLETFTRELFLRPGEPMSLSQPAGTLHHMASWWPRHNDPDVLWVFYEDMKENLPAQVDRVASFMGITDRATIAQAVDKSTFAFMKQHESQYNDARLKRALNSKMGFPAEGGTTSSKVRVGGGQRNLLSDASKAAIDAKWQAVCEPVMGAKSYAEWRATWKAEQAAL